MKHKKPSKLDWILALTPVPILGELSAKEIAEYESEQFIKYSNMYLESEPFMSDRDENSSIMKRIISFRLCAYVLIPGLMTIGYGFYKPFFN